MRTNRHHKLAHCKKAIETIDTLVLRMEHISREYFEANVDFISKAHDTSLREEFAADGGLSLYDQKFKSILDGLEDDIKRLKKEKIHYQFRHSLLTERDVVLA